MLDSVEIHSEADFAEVEYSTEDIEEVERLFEASPGKDFNISDSEYAAIEAKLRPRRQGIGRFGRDQVRTDRSLQTLS